MRIRRGLAGVAASAALGALVAAAPAQAVPQTVYGLGQGANFNTLYAFTVQSPGTITATTPVTGLGAGETLIGIDFRPATGQLYGVAVNGNTASTYVVNQFTGAASLVGSATVMTIVGATAYGIDFNPVTDRIRVVNNFVSDGAAGNANNFRLNPNNGSLAGVDPDLDFTGLPGGEVMNVPEVAVAYDNNTAGAVTTTLRGIVSGGDRVVINGPPGPGFQTLQNVGLLQEDTSTNAGFDIDRETGAGYAVLEVGGVTRLYSINLTSGQATRVTPDNRVGLGTVDFAGFAIPTHLPELAYANTLTSVSEGDTAEVTVTRTGEIGGTSTVEYATEVGGANNAGGTDFTPSEGTLTFGPGVASQTISVPTTEDGDDEPDETLQVRLGNPFDARIPGDPVATVNIADDDVDPKDTVPPVGLISVPTQKIDRSIKASFACDDACASKLTLKLGSKTLDTDSQSLADAGVGRVTFALSAKEVRLVKRKARGPRSAKLRVLGSFSDAQGESSSTAKFQLG